MPDAWPVSSGLPNYLALENANETFPDNTLRYKTDVGPPKLRRRSTAAPTIFVGSMTLNSSQTSTFETFYKTTLMYGSLPFEWVHPRTRNAAVMRFVGPPSLVPIGGIYWTLNMTLEIMP